MSNNPFSGALYLFKGFHMIKQPGVRQFAIIPLIINTLIFAGLGIFMFGWFGDFIDGLMLGLPDWLQWLEWLVWPIFAAALGILIYFTFAILANFISAPFNGVLSEAVEEKVTGVIKSDDSPWHQAITQAPKAVREEVRKLVYSVTRSLPFLILLLIPGINFIASVLWILFGAWMLAIQYTDYPLANNGIEFNDQRKLLKQKRLLVIGFGGVVMIGMMIPVVNFIILPCAVAGATLMYIDHFKQPAN
ncbi:MAG: sulfate transporter CysZ [Gammaproteobacteria bacterium]|nr:sulfate transporter CysZ [Gammaproteobacteria bacterium]